MTARRWWRSGCASLAVTSLLMQPVVAADAADVIQGSPSTSPAALQYASNPGTEPALPHAIKQALLRSKIKYVFVIFQENRSYDSYFGTFPVANGLFSQPASATPGSVQKIVNVDGSVGTVSPFLIPQTVKTLAAGTAGPVGTSVPLYPADTGSVDHSEAGIDNSLDLSASFNAANDRYALDEEKLTTNASGAIVSSSTGLAPTAPPTLAQKQMGELAVSHIDCDTIPFLWQYADRFAMFDDFHQTVIGPSTPNAIAMIAGQSGLTQWALHPNESTASTGTTPWGSKLATYGVPIYADPGPFPGSNYDNSPVKPPYGNDDDSPANPAINQTYATLPLSFMGRDIMTTTAADQNPTVDLADVRDDMRLIAGENLPPTAWGWYELGYDSEPTDPHNNGTLRSDYIVHHEGPQYFGYIGDNPKVAQNHLFGQGKFYNDVANGALAPSGGVYYIRGGYGNLDGLIPVDPNPAVQAGTIGNDDHPGYSDAQISEASVADTVNAIAHSKYWSQSAIVITYDETDGLYDHGPVAIRSIDPEGKPIGAGPRIPAIVISPYGNAHVIVNSYSEHGSVIKFIDEMFGLTPLSDLPNELIGRIMGYFEFGQFYLSPSDGLAEIGDLFPAFDNARLLGLSPPLPASLAEIDPTAVHSLPHYASTGGCKALQIVPTDYVNGAPIDPPPADFNPRPSQTPGIPTGGSWTP